MSAIVDTLASQSQKFGVLLFFPCQFIKVMEYFYKGVFSRYWVGRKFIMNNVYHGVYMETSYRIL